MLCPQGLCSDSQPRSDHGQARSSQDLNQVTHPWGPVDPRAGLGEKHLSLGFCKLPTKVRITSTDSFTLPATWSPSQGRISVVGGDVCFPLRSASPQSWRLHSAPTGGLTVPQVGVQAQLSQFPSGLSRTRTCPQAPLGFGNHLSPPDLGLRARSLLVTLSSSRLPRSQPRGCRPLACGLLSSQRLGHRHPVPAGPASPPHGPSTPGQPLSPPHAGEKV